MYTGVFMKKAFSFILCILMCVSLISCSDTQVTFNDYPVSQFESRDLLTKAFAEFTFRYPAAWSVEIEENIDNIKETGTIFGAFSPHGVSGYSSSFLVVAAKNQQVETTDIKKEYILSLLEDMQEQTGNPYEVTDFGYYYLGGEETVIYTAKTTVEEGVEATVTQAMIVIDGTLYVFNLNTYGEENIGDTNAILSSLHFKDAEEPENTPDYGDVTDDVVSDDNVTDTPADGNSTAE